VLGEGRSRAGEEAVCQKYLAIEGFIEQAIGALDPEPDSEVKAMLDSIVFS